MNQSCFFFVSIYIPPNPPVFGYSIKQRIPFQRKPMKKHHHMDVHKQSQCQSYHPQVFGTYLHIKHFSPIKSLDCPFLYPWVLMAKTKGKAAEQAVPVKRRHFEKSPPDSASGSIKVKPFYKDKRFQAPVSDKSGTKETQRSSKAKD